MNELRRESPYPMVSVAEAQRLIGAALSPLPTETVSSLAADGRVLAEDVYAGEDVPGIARAQVDGYALRAEDGRAPRQVLGEVTAGGEQVALLPGTAVRIMTGAPLPQGADAVVMVEHTEERSGQLFLEQGITAGAHVQLAGQDLARNQQMLQRGRILGAAEIGLLATVGQTRIRVYRRPRVAVLSTGDEVVEPDTATARRVGDVRDSNRYALLAAVREAGAEGISLGIAPDVYEVQRAAILRALDLADVLITSGGVSMGTRDLIKPLLAELGTVHFGRVLFKPGKPTLFVTIDRPGHGPFPVFGLPGFPVSSLVSFEVFVRPALRRLQGDAEPERPLVRVTLDNPIQPAADRPEYQRAVVSWQDGRLLARSTGSQRSSRLLSLSGANCLVRVPAGTRVYQPGEELEALLTGPLAGEQLVLDDGQ